MGAGGMRPALRIAWIALLVLTPLVTLWLIAQEGENVPFYDEWVLVPLFQAHDAGQLGPGDFFRQHNEHRIAFPLAADFLTGLLTQWDLRAELYRNSRSPWPPRAARDRAAALARPGGVPAGGRRRLDRLLLAGALRELALGLAARRGSSRTSRRSGRSGRSPVTIDRSWRWKLAPRSRAAPWSPRSLARSGSAGLALSGSSSCCCCARPSGAWAAMGAGCLPPLLQLAGARPLEDPGFERPVDLVEFFLLYLGRTLGNSNTTGELRGARPPGHLPRGRGPRPAQPPRRRARQPGVDLAGARALRARRRGS